MQLTEHDTVQEYVYDVVDQMDPDVHDPESVANECIVSTENVGAVSSTDHAQFTLNTVGFRGMGRLTPFEVLSGSEFVADVDSTYREKAVEILAWLIEEEQADRASARAEIEAEKELDDQRERHFDRNGHF